MRAVKVFGTCARQFDRVKHVFIENFRTGGDIGASVCVYFRGQKVVDLWAGHAVQPGDKKDTEREWASDTLCNVYSCSKVRFLMLFLFFGVCLLF